MRHGSVAFYALPRLPCGISLLGARRPHFRSTLTSIKLRRRIRDAIEFNINSRIAIIFIH